MSETVDMWKRANKKKKKASVKKNNMLKAQMLKELMLDFDWKAAGQRLNLTSSQVSVLRKDEDFKAKGEAIIQKGIEETSGAKSAIDKFMRTQKILMDELEAGETKVASSLVKTHELEYKMHGLFEKDNKQKAQSTAIVINFADTSDIKDIDGEIIDG